MAGTIKGSIFLMYHELRLAGRALCSVDPGYVRYVVDEATFRAQMDRLASRGISAQGVSAWLDAPEQNTSSVVVTFDDGCETDLIAAAPILRERGFGATCYLTVNFLDRPGYLSRSQARELSDAGIEVGCHSMSHAYLSDLDDEGLRREIVQAKEALEQICGSRIRSFSCPGGRYDDRVLSLARSAGYDSVTTSRAVRNVRSSPVGLLGRLAILSDMDMDTFDASISGHDARSRQIRDAVLSAAKSVLGNTLYERVRGRLLG